MIQRFIVWILDKLRSLFDPDFAKRKAEYESERASVEQQEASAAIVIANTEAEITSIEKRKQELASKQAASLDAVKTTEDQRRVNSDEVQKQLDSIERASDDDELRKPL